MNKLVAIGLIIVIIFPSLLLTNNSNLKNKNITTYSKEYNQLIYTSKGIHGHMIPPEVLEQLQLTPSKSAPEKYVHMQSLSKWWDPSWEYRINVTISAPSGIDYTDWPVDVYVKFDPPAFKYSIRVIEVGLELREIPYQLWNVTYYNSSHIRAATVTFLVSIPGGQSKKYQIYWSIDYTDPPVYETRVEVISQSTAEGTLYIVRSKTKNWEIELPPINGGKASNMTLPSGYEIGHDWLHFGTTRNSSTSYGGYWGTGNTNNMRYTSRYFLEDTDLLLANYKGVIFVTYVVENLPLYDSTLQRDVAYVNITYRIFDWGMIIEEKIKWLEDDYNVYYYIGGWVFDQDDGYYDSTFNAIGNDTNIIYYRTYSPFVVTDSISGGNSGRSFINDLGIPLLSVYFVYLTAGSHTVYLDYLDYEWDDSYIYVFNASGTLIYRSYDYNYDATYTFSVNSNGWYYIVIGCYGDDNGDGYLKYNIYIDGNLIASGVRVGDFDTTDGYTVPYTAIKLYYINVTSETVNNIHNVTLHWYDGSNLDVFVYGPPSTNPESGHLLVYSANTIGNETLSFTPTEVNYYPVLVYRRTAAVTLTTFTLDIKVGHGLEYIDIYNLKSLDHVALFSNTTLHGIGYVELENKVLSGSLSYSDAGLMWYNEGDDSEDDYIIITKWINVTSVTTGTVYVYRYSVFPWTPTGASLDEMYLVFKNIKDSLKTPPTISKADIERYKIQIIVNVVDGDLQPIRNAIVKLINSSGLVEVLGYTNATGKVVFDVPRKAYSFLVEINSANITYTNDTVKEDYTKFAYKIHTDSKQIKFSNLVKIAIKTYTATTPRQVIQDGDVFLSNGSIVLHGKTNLTGWFDAYISKGKWYLAFNAVAPVTPDTYDNISVYTDPDFANQVGSGTNVSLGTISTVATYYIIDNDITSSPYITNLVLHNTPTGFSVYWKERITIHVNMTRKDPSTGEVVMWNGILHWYILDSTGKCILKGDVEPHDTGMFTFEIDTSQVSAGATYTILINATPDAADRDILKPAPLYISLEVKKRPLSVDISFSPGNTIYWNESLSTVVSVYDGLSTTTPIVGATVYMIIYTPSGSLKLKFDDKGNGEYVNTTKILLDAGSYTAIVHVEKNNYEIVEKSYTIVVKERPTYVVAPSYIETPWVSSYTIEVQYIDERFSMPIRNAEVAYNLTNALTGELIIPTTSMTYSNGKYVATLDLTNIDEGSYILTIFFGKRNYENVTLTIPFRINVRKTSAISDTTRLHIIYGERIIIKINYYDEDFDEYIVGATTRTYSITSTISEATPITGELIDLNNGSYLLNVSSESIGQLGSFIITITLGKKHYETQSVTVTLVIDPIPTEKSTETTTVTTEWGIPIDITLNYTTQDGKGISGANATFVIKYGDEVRYKGKLEDKGNGMYRLYLNSSAIVNDSYYVFGTYTIYIHLGKQYYENQTIVITWTIEKISTYCSPREISLELEYGENITVNYLLWYYRYGTEVKLSGIIQVKIEILKDSTTIYSMVENINLINGEYKLNLNTTAFIADPSQLGPYTIRITFSKRFFEDTIAIISLVVKEISTVASANPSNVTLIWGDIANVTLEWRMLREYKAICDAQVNITVIVEGKVTSVPPKAIRVIPHGDIYILCVNSSLLQDGVTYEIIVTFSKPFYQTKSTTTYVIVNSIPTVSKASTTQVSTEWGLPIDVLVNYTTSDGQPITNANATFVIRYGNRTIYKGLLCEVTSGVYKLYLNSSVIVNETNYVFGAYTIYIHLGKHHYENQTVIITWTIDKISTYCNPREISEELEYNENITVAYTLWYYRDGKEVKITGATAIAQVIIDGTVIYSVKLIELGNGRYLLNLNTSMFINASNPRLGAYTIRITFTKKYFKEATAIISLTIKEISTTAIANPSNVTLYWGETINITLEWRMLRDYRKIPNAEIFKNITAVEGSIVISQDAIQIYEINGTYTLYVDTSLLVDGFVYVINVTFTKQFYQTQSCLVYVTVEPISASVALSTTELEITWGDDANITVTIIDAYGNGVTGVEISINTTAPANAIFAEEIGAGIYTIVVKGGLLAAGTNYTVLLTFEKEHYNIPSRSLIIIVKRVIARVEVETSTSIYKGISPFDYGKASSKLTIRVCELPYNIPLNITGEVLLNNVTIAKIDETTMIQPGVYEITITWNNIEPGTYILEIRILTLKRKKYIGTWSDVILPIIIINGAPSRYPQVTVNVDFITGSERIGGIVIPRIYFWIVVGLIIFGFGAGFIKFYMWWKLPAEVKELNKIIKLVKRGIYEYEVPPRRELISTYISKELSLE